MKVVAEDVDMRAADAGMGITTTVAAETMPVVVATAVQFRAAIETAEKGRLDGILSV